MPERRDEGAVASHGRDGRATIIEGSEPALKETGAEAAGWARLLEG